MSIEKMTISFLEFNINLECDISIVNKLSRKLVPFFALSKGHNPIDTETFVVNSNIHDYINLIRKIKKQNNVVNLHSGNKGFFFEDNNYYYYLYLEENMLNIICKQDNVFLVISDFSKDDKILELVKQIRCIFLNKVNKNNFYRRGHVGALRINDAIYLLAGPKGAGKTSFLTTALRSRGHNIEFITNDKAILDNNLNVWGLPYAVSISKECVNECEEINVYSSRITDTKKMLYWPNVFCDFFSKDIILGGKISGIIIPDLKLLQTIRIAITDQKEREIIEKSIFNDKDKNNPEWLIKREYQGKTDINQSKLDLSSIKHIKISGDPWRSDWVSLLTNHLSIPNH